MSSSGAEPGPGLKRRRSGSVTPPSPKRVRLNPGAAPPPPPRPPRPPRTPGITVSTSFADPQPDPEAQREWLRRSKTWAGLPHNDWVADRVLGGGGHGIVGRFAYIGSNPDYPSDMAVKQVAAVRSRRGLKWESKLLRKLTEANLTSHIVKLYKSYHQEGGTGALAEMDPLPFKTPTSQYEEGREVSRIYLEFLSGEDLWRTASYIDQEREQGHFPPEEDMYRMFLCIARSVLVLETGSEDPDTPVNNWQRIMHFDIKPDNYVISKADPRDAADTREHKHLPKVKLIDFGLALPWPRKQPITKEWWSANRWRGTTCWRPPEQIFKPADPHEPEKMDHHKRLAIWNIGAVMHFLITGHEVSMEEGDRRTQAFYYIPQGQHNQILAVGDMLFTKVGCQVPVMLKDAQGRLRLDPQGRGIWHPDHHMFVPYSAHLMDLVVRCLAWRPNDRPTIADLVRTLQIKDAEFDQWYIDNNQPDQLKPITEWRSWRQVPQAERFDRSKSVVTNDNGETYHDISKFPIQISQVQGGVASPSADPGQNRLLLGGWDVKVQPVAFANYPHRAFSFARAGP